MSKDWFQGTGFDFNGDGHVSLEEEMMSHKVVNDAIHRSNEAQSGKRGSSKSSRPGSLYLDSVEHPLGFWLFVFAVCAVFFFAAEASSHPGIEGAAMGVAAIFSGVWILLVVVVRHISKRMYIAAQTKEAKNKQNSSNS